MMLRPADKAILFLTFYVAAVLFGVFLGWYMYKDSFENCKEDFNICVDRYNELYAENNGGDFFGENISFSGFREIERDNNGS